MAETRGQLTEEVATAVLELLHAMHAVATPALCQMDVTMSQVKAMLTVSMSGESTVGDIARSLSVGQPAASTTVDRLVHLGWADRLEDPVDRRRTLVRLTQEGRQLVEMVWRLRRDLLLTWLSRMEKRDLSLLAQGIVALQSAAAGVGAEAQSVA